MKSVSLTSNLRATVCAALTLLFLAGCAQPASAAPGHWYEPSKNGVGIQIDQNLHGFGHQVTWYLYREDGSTAFLSGAETCESFPCVIPLVEPTAYFMGGGLELGDPVGTLEIGVYDGDLLPVVYDLREWRPESCFDIGPGGLIFRQCVGRLSLQLLTE